MNTTSLIHVQYNCFISIKYAFSGSYSKGAGCLLTKICDIFQFKKFKLGLVLMKYMQYKSENYFIGIGKQILPKFQIPNFMP